MLQKNKTSKYIYHPLLASEELTGGVVSQEEMREIWTTFSGLPPERKAILLSEELAQKMVKFQEVFNCSDTMVESVSVIVRWYFFGFIEDSELTGYLRGVVPEKSEQATDFLKNEVFSLKPKPVAESSEEVVSQRRINRLALLKAITEYPRLNDQLMTNEKIKVKGQPEPQRPSLANWIRYYRDELGVGFHDQVLRGRFLFQSENGKRLSNEERERINLILKSIEEDFPLDIDVEQGVIIFPTRSAAPTPKAPVATKPLFPPQENAVPARTVKPYVPTGSMNPASGVGTASAAPQSKPSFFASKLSPAKNVAGETLHFSTGHVLPGEKAGAQPNNQSAPATPAQAAATPQVSAQPTSPTPASPTVPFRSSGINQNRGAALPRSPYSIRPLRLRDDVGAKEE